MSSELGAAVSPPALAALCASMVCVAASGVLYKRVPPGHPTAALAVGAAIGCPILLVASALVHESWALPVRAETWVSFGFLVPVATVLNFQLAHFVLGRWTASGSSYGGLLSPLVTVVLAAIILAEPIGMATAVGGALILLGVWLGAFSRARVRVSRAPTADGSVWVEPA